MHGILIAPASQYTDSAQTRIGKSSVHRTPYTLSLASKILTSTPGKCCCKRIAEYKPDILLNLGAREGEESMILCAVQTCSSVQVLLVLTEQRSRGSRGSAIPHCYFQDRFLFWFLGFWWLFITVYMYIKIQCPSCAKGFDLDGLDYKPPINLISKKDLREEFKEATWSSSFPLAW